MVIGNLSKPFSTFKWRWATLTPTESLNDPRVSFGVLRAMKKAEGLMPSHPTLFNLLQQAQTDLGSYLPANLQLARSLERNLLRNSQQYWKAVGLLETTTGGIHLTQFGRDVADGGITREEFAATVIKTLSLPNTSLETSAEVALWHAHGLSFKPLELLLSIAERLFTNNPNNGYLTPDEVRRVIVPLSGINSSVDEHVAHILEFRLNPNSCAHFPDCAPSSNDHRMIREFLLFLEHHGFLNYQQTSNRFYLDGQDIADIVTLTVFNASSSATMVTASELSKQSAIGTAKRKRVLASVLARPGQPKFRRDVLTAAGSQCLLTGEIMGEVLEACHIIPVQDGGLDEFSNGLCLRSDIHSLYDSMHLRIHPDGVVSKSTAMTNSSIYSNLPPSINLPTYVNKDALRWRNACK